MNRKQVTSCLVGTLLLFAGASVVSGLDPGRSVAQFVHESWEVGRGLPQNSVLDIVQGPRGYLWMATFGGLARFDGVRFEVFDKASTPEMKENSVWAVLVDSKGRFWIGTNGGGLLILEDGRFTVIGADAGLPSEFVTTLVEDAAGRIWVGTPAGLAHQDGDGFVLVPEVAAAVLVLAADRDGSVWAGTDGRGIYHIDGDSVASFDQEHGLPADVVRAVYVDPKDGRVWAGTAGRGLVYFAEGTWLVHEASTPLLEDVRTMLRDRRGNLWIGSGHNGLFRLADGRLENFNHDDGLTDDTVVALCEDVEGSLWIGTYRGGLNRLRDGKLITVTRRQGLSHDQIRSVFASSDGSIWLGTVGGGANRLRDGEVDVISTAQGLSNDLLWSFAEGRDGSIWMGTYGGGLNRWKDGEISVFTTDSGLSHNLIRALMEDVDGNLWIGTSGGGIDIRRPDGRFDHLGTADGLPSDSIFSILQDTTGVIWVGTYGGGVARIVDSEIEILSVENGLGHGVAWSLTEDEDQPGTIWIGTNGGGVSRWQDGRIRTYSMREGLHNDVVFQILDDGAGTLWMSSQNGLFTVTKRVIQLFDRGRARKVKCVTYGHSDGMRTWGCNGPSSPAGARDGSGRLWFPTTKGAVVVDPQNITGNSVVPPVVIERFLADGREMNPRKEAVLEPGTARLEFRFTALSLLAPEKVRFRFRLEGLEDNWNEVTERRIAQYDRLPPGRYIFRVLACNNDGVWNETGASLPFLLRPFFYQTKLFYLLCVLGVFALGAGVVMIRMIALRKRERELSRVVDVRTQELAQANEELTRLANQDGLTGIANHRYLAGFVNQEWRRCRRHDKPLSMVMFDVDFFKKFNDRYGHQEGDECLKRVAAVLDRGARRAGDLAGRYGGEEFMLVFSDTDAEGALAVAERARKEVEDLGIPHEDGGGQKVVTISGGIATLVPDDTNDAASLLRHADQALYSAKHRGRNRIEAWVDEEDAGD